MEKKMLIKKGALQYTLDHWIWLSEATWTTDGATKKAMKLDIYSPYTGTHTVPNIQK